MKLLLIVFTGCCFSSIRAQVLPIESWDGSYRAMVSKGKHAFTTVSLTLAGPLYLIQYESIDKGVVKHQKRYVGTFSINSERLLHLRGKHPFRTNDFLLQDTILDCEQDKIKQGYDKKREIGFNTRAIESLSTKRGYKLNLRKVMYKRSNYSYWEGGGGYYDFFRPEFRQIYQEQTIRDRVFNEILSKQGIKCNVKEEVPLNNSKNNYSENRLFGVDSIRFDTLYVNKLLLEKRNSYSIQKDTFCLNKTEKIQFQNVQTNYFFLQEGTEVFDFPDYESIVFYEREETDLIDNLRITDYFIDWSGVEWIKVELEVRTYNEQAQDETDEQYLSKKVTGWMLQESLSVG